jgi:hypothetical protein
LGRERENGKEETLREMTLTLSLMQGEGKGTAGEGKEKGYFTTKLISRPGT